MFHHVSATSQDLSGSSAPDPAGRSADGRGSGRPAARLQLDVVCGCGQDVDTRHLRCTRCGCRVAS